jgi:3-hydroxyacyl-[acyl-carrier-protein] dehydratase
MVLVDRVVALEPGVSIEAIKTVSGSEPCYAGLDPTLDQDRYAYPMSLVIESFGQAAAVLWLHSDPTGCGDRGSVLMFAAARDCEFVSAAYPGDLLHHRVRLERTVAGTAFASGDTRVGERTIASYASMVAVVRPEATLRVALDRCGQPLGVTDPRPNRIDAEGVRADG